VGAGTVDDDQTRSLDRVTDHADKHEYKPKSPLLSFTLDKELSDDLPMRETVVTLRKKPKPSAKPGKAASGASDSDVTLEGWGGDWSHDAWDGSEVASEAASEADGWGKSGKFQSGDFGDARDRLASGDEGKFDVFGGRASEMTPEAFLSATAPKVCASKTAAPLSGDCSARDGSWLSARDSCEAVGARLCTEAELR